MNKYNLTKYKLTEGEYWDKFEEEAAKYGVPIWVDYQNANTSEIGFINYSTDPQIDKAVLGKRKKAFIKLVKGGKVLDLGCGAGWLCLELARKGCQVLGIDISSKRIKKAKDYARMIGIKINYRVDDIEKLKWIKRETYDYIVNWNSLHHVEDVEKILEGAQISLKKGGHFISWDHLGDNFIISGATKFASLVPGFYRQKKDILGDIHSESEGIAEVRLTKDFISKYFKLITYRKYLAFVHLLPPIYKFLKLKLRVPIPRNLFLHFLRLTVKLDNTLVKLFPTVATYSFVVAQKLDEKSKS